MLTNDDSLGWHLGGELAQCVRRVGNPQLALKIGTMRLDETTFPTSGKSQTLAELPNERD